MRRVRPAPRAAHLPAGQAASLVHCGGLHQVGAVPSIIQRAAAQRAAVARKTRACSRLACSCLPAHIRTAPQPASSNPMRAAPCLPCSQWRKLQVLGTCFLAKRFLRLRRPDGTEEHLGRPPPAAELACYRCTGARSSLLPAGGCGADLFESRDILSRWVGPGCSCRRCERQEGACGWAMQAGRRLGCCRLCHRVPPLHRPSTAPPPPLPHASASTASTAGMPAAALSAPSSSTRSARVRWRRGTNGRRR
mgnify:CR=1 FL=1